MNRAIQTCLLLALCLAVNDGKPEDKRIYDNKGDYLGRTYGDKKEQRVFDNKGNYMGRIKTDPVNPNQQLLFDNNGNYKGRTIK